MLRYFIAANFWLFVALVLYVGRKFERGDPTRYSVFGVGQWFSPNEYWWLISAALAIATTCFVLLLISRNQKKPE